MKKSIRCQGPRAQQDTKASGRCPSAPPGNLHTPKTVAARAGYTSPVSVLRAFRRGELRGFRINARVVRFAEEDVADWLAKARV
ncbi:MAG: hypothetical protein ABSH34_11345 [Verrucomicrobiota bacterium]|jgi:hypothetical protein